MKKVKSIFFGLSLILTAFGLSCDDQFDPSKEEKEESDSDQDGTDVGDSNNDQDNGTTETIHGSVIDTKKQQVLSNPEVKLTKPYWVVVKNLEKSSEGEGVCFFSPRPDNNATAKVECSKDTPLADKLEQYDFCRETVRPEIMNNIPCDIALEISTLINNGLLFTDTGPYPFESDKAAACNLTACSAHEDLQSFCSYYKSRYEASQNGDPVTAIARLDTDEEMAAILPCLNELYGIEPPVDQTETESQCTEAKPAADYICMQDCGDPVVSEDSPTPGWSWLSPEDAANREMYGCPICLPPDTKIATPKGEKDLRNIASGDLVWSKDRAGKKIKAKVIHAASTPTPTGHKIVHLRLADGRQVGGSPGHPTADGRHLEDISVGDWVDGAQVVAVFRREYSFSRTYDLLPDSETGTYWANGILLGSTLKVSELYISAK